MDEEGEMDVEAPGNKLTSTLLHIAVKMGDVTSVCEFLEEMGYDVNTRDSENNTPLHVAAESGNVDILNLLLRKGALVNVQNNQEETPLHKAASSTVSEIVENLLKSGGSVNVYDKRDCTPFHIAVSKGYKKVIELMLDWGADVDSTANNDQTPLHIAAIHWNCILAEILLDRGADVNAVDDEGKTPLHLAVSRVDMTMTELLIERGADINAPDYEGQTSLHLAANHWNYRIVKMLLNKGSLINSQNNKGQTALHIAVNNGDLTLVNRLLERGALTDTFDTQNLTPLQYAVNNDYSKVILKLISKGADTSVFLADQHTYDTLQHCPSSGSIIQVHIAKLHWSHPEELPNFWNRDENSKLKEMCLHELEIIKTKKVTDMSGNEYALINLLDEQKYFDLATCKLFEIMLNSPEIDTEFPFYAFILKVSLLRMKKRHIFIKAAQIFFVIHNLFYGSIRTPFPTLPPSVSENILSRLGYVDLQNVIVATENTLRVKTYSC